MTDPIARFIRALGAAGVTLDYRDARDILWLSRLMPTPTGPQLLPSPPDARKTVSRPDAPQQTPPSTSTRSERDQKRRPLVTVAEPASPGVYLPSHAHAGTGTRRASAVKVPAAPALPASLEIARSLRPFMRKRASPRRLEFDAEATVERFADTNVLAPVLRPARGRWFDVALVIDDGPSMVVWKDTAAAFHRLLGRLGAFRDVRRWTIGTSDAAVRLVSESGLVQDWNELMDTSGKRLVVMFSDFVGPQWDDATLWTALSELARAMPVALLHSFPERLWSSTTVGHPGLVVSNRFPGAPNTMWDVEEAPWEDTAENTVALPVVTLQPDSTKAWARVVMGAGSAALPAVRVGVRASPDRESELATETVTAAERVTHFKEFVSPTAYQLAIYLSAVPLSLPVMRLVQRTMLPASRQVHLAEFFVGGLIERVTDATADVSPDEVAYDFHRGVREQLQGSFSRSEVLRVLRAVSDYLAENYGQPLDFRALIADPAGAYTLPDYAVPFATLGGRLLQRVSHLAGDQLTPAPEIQEEEYAPGLTIRWTHRAEDVQRVAWSWNGEMLAVQTETEVAVLNARTGGLVPGRTVTASQIVSLAWAPDRDELAIVEAARLTFTTDTDTRMRAMPGEEPFYQVAYDRSGGVAVMFFSGRVEFWDYNKNKRAADEALALGDSSPPLPPPPMAWSPDARLLAWLTEDGRLFIRQGSGRTEEWQRLEDSAEANYANRAEPLLAWHPDGVLLATCHDGAMIHVTNVADREVVKRLLARGVRSLSFSRDGSLFAAGTLEEIVIRRTDTWQVVARVPRTSASGALEFSPAGDSLAVVDGDDVHLLRVQRDVLLRPVAERALPQVFMSYERNERARFARLLERLDELARQGVCRLVTPGETATWQAVLEAVDASEIFVPLITRSYSESQSARAEVDLALYRRVNSPAFRIIPFALEAVGPFHSGLSTQFQWRNIAVPEEQWDDVAFPQIVTTVREAVLPWATGDLLDGLRAITVRIDSRSGHVGSGVVVTHEGHIVTTDYVARQIERQSGSTLTDSDGELEECEVLHIDERARLAVLRAAGRTAALQGVSTTSRGDVVACGYGASGHVDVRFGAIAATRDDSVFVTFADDQLQGWGGGPVVDETGKLVGVIHSAGQAGEQCVSAARVSTFLEERGIWANGAPRRRSDASAADLGWVTLVIGEVEGGELEFTIATATLRQTLRQSVNDLAAVARVLNAALTTLRADEGLARTFFETVIPLEFRDLLTRASALRLVLDPAVAGQPWELLHHPQHPEALALRGPMVRSLLSREETVPLAVLRHEASRALVIGPAQTSKFPPLRGAMQEVESIAETLRSAGLSVSFLREPTARDVLNTLYKGEHDLLHIAGHGVHRFGDQQKSGVVLGDNEFLTAREILQLPRVPGFVFLNVEYAGAIGPVAGSEQIGANTSLIVSFLHTGAGMLIAPSGFVHDQAAAVFAESVYRAVLQYQSLPNAVLEARRETHRRFPGDLSWASYQCYCDPDARLELRRPAV